MSDLRDLYQEVILDHSRDPRNFREASSATHQAHGHNPLCGDRVTIFATVEDGKVSDVSFQGSGCAISTASASMLTEALRGKPVDEAKEIFDSFHGMLTGQVNSADARTKLGKLSVFAGVCEYPARVKCATLAWHTLQSALNEDEAPVSTE